MYKIYSCEKYVNYILNHVLVGDNHVQQQSTQAFKNRVEHLQQVQALLKDGYSTIVLLVGLGNTHGYGWVSRWGEVLITWQFFTFIFSREYIFRMDLSSPTEQRHAVDAAYDEIFPMPGRWQLIDLVAFVLVRSTIQRSHLGRPLGLVWFAWFGLLYFDWLVYLLLQDLPDPLHQGHLGRQQRGCLRHLHLEFNIVFRIFFLRPWNKKTPRQVQPSFLGLLFRCDFHSVL